MGSASRSSRPLSDRLAARARRVFVGRDAELEIVRSALDSPEPSIAVLYLYGPGGIGKTCLLGAISDLAERSHRAVTVIDGRNTDASPGSVLASVDRHIGDRPRVLLLDSYERLRVLDDWIRTDFLPGLPATTLTVIADRSPPSAGWRTDPGWGDLLRIVSLRNFDPATSAAYLTAARVPEELHDEIIGATHGHPLGLGLLTDVFVRGGDVRVPWPPDLVGMLLRRFLNTEPGIAHRRALEVCALARVTTEALLRDALELTDAHAEFEWLRELSFVEAGPDGLFPHDLARDVLDADLRWRDPDAYRYTFHRVWKGIRRGLDSAGECEQQQAIVDLKFVFRNLPGVLSPVDWQSWGSAQPERAEQADHSAIVDLVRTSEGDESAVHARRWLERQPEGFFVLRDTDGSIRGVLGLLELSRASPEDVRADPATRAAWDFARRTAPSRPGECVAITRIVIDRADYQNPSPTMNSVPVLTFQRYFTLPHLSWDFLALAEPDRWNEYFAVADLPRAEGADFTVGDRHYGLFAHDFRRRDVDEWLTVVTDRALVQGHSGPEPTMSLPLALSEKEFAEAVRNALHDLRRPDLLSRNPLLHTRVLHKRSSPDDPDPVVLRALLREAIDSLASDPRDDKLFRAVDRTYVRGAATQEAAAARLGLPFSTYRRHLTRGVTRVVGWLWDLEVYGEAPSGREHM
ncbi:ATP-binding protein [Rhodococcus sp. DMU2021]|uniref:ATP-binding protein n=1 Tax=Rhodococcus sp. DMU2021 TaxID=2866997 RepID=UPI001C7D2456|nr:ATP-binding protein [Rhodococcus sp. DMU2021]MBX4167921.1 ATP-binding protein [Rhodococcus sp. DMU2021]